MLAMLAHPRLRAAPCPRARCHYNCHRSRDATASGGDTMTLRLSVICLLALFSWQPASAATLDDLVARLARLEAENKTLRARVTRLEGDAVATSGSDRSRAGPLSAPQTRHSASPAL